MNFTFPKEIKLTRSPISYALLTTFPLKGTLVLWQSKLTLILSIENTNFGFKTFFWSKAVERYNGLGGQHFPGTQHQNNLPSLSQLSKQVRDVGKNIKEDK